MRPSGRGNLAAVYSAILIVASVAVVTPSPVRAQLGAIEALARRVTDLSFNAHFGGLSPSSDELRADALGLRSFGLELLFEVGAVDEVVGPAPVVADTAALTWTEMVVVVSDDGVDTTYVYEVGAPPRPAAPTRAIWSFELGIGYGQLIGFKSADPTLELRGQVRDLPSATIYASYEPLGSYFGLRSGFMKLQGLQAFDADDVPFSGKAESFLLGGVLGHAAEVAGIFVFFEVDYSVRHFPSVEWRTVQSGTSLVPSLPRKLSFSGWSIGTGVQFGMGG